MPKEKGKLSLRQREAAMMVAMDCSNHEIAAKFHCSVACVKNWRKLPAFEELAQAEADKLIETTRKDLSVKYREASLEAFGILRNQMHSVEPYVAQNAARIILDKFHAMAEKFESSSIEIKFTNMPPLGEAGSAQSQKNLVDITSVTPEVR